MDKNKKWSVSFFRLAELAWGGGGGGGPCCSCQAKQLLGRPPPKWEVQTWLANVFLHQPLERKNPRQAGKGNSPPTTKGKEARRLRPDVNS